MSDIAAEKARLRALLSQQRKALSSQQRTHIDECIAEAVCQHTAFRAAQLVFTYISVGDEVDTRAIIRTAWEQGKTVVAPRCTGPRQMAWYRIDDFQHLETSSFGVEEPPANPENLMSLPAPQCATPAVALVPGFTFDAQGFRLGYGGGFYDTFLPQFNGTSLGLCRACFFSSEPLPRNEFDVAVDEVVCA